MVLDAVPLLVLQIALKGVNEFTKLSKTLGLSIECEIKSRSVNSQRESSAQTSSEPSVLYNKALSGELVSIFGLNSNYIDEVFLEIVNSSDSCDDISLFKGSVTSQIEEKAESTVEDGDVLENFLTQHIVPQKKLYLPVVLHKPHESQKQLKFRQHLFHKDDESVLTQIYQYANLSFSLFQNFAGYSCLVSLRQIAIYLVTERNKHQQTKLSKLLLRHSDTEKNQSTDSADDLKYLLLKFCADTELLKSLYTDTFLMKILNEGNLHTNLSKILAISQTDFTYKLKVLKKHFPFEQRSTATEKMPRVEQNHSVSVLSKIEQYCYLISEDFKSDERKVSVNTGNKNVFTEVRYLREHLVSQAESMKRQRYQMSTNAYVNIDVMCDIALSEKKVIVVIPTYDRNVWDIQKISMLKNVYMYDDSGACLNEKLAFTRFIEQLPLEDVVFIFRKIKSGDLYENSEIMVALKSGDEIKVLQSVSERCKSKPNYRLAVVTAEVFEEAMRQCQIFEYNLTYSNYFPRDCKMIIGIPVYKGGFINRRDNKDRGTSP